MGSHESGAALEARAIMGPGHVDMRRVPEVGWRSLRKTQSPRGLLIALLVGMLLVGAPAAWGQGACVWDVEPSGGVGAGCPGLQGIYALQVYDDGTGSELYVGGHFSTAGAVGVSHVARWDGSQWAALAGGLSGSSCPDVARALAVHDDGQGRSLYVGGAFAAAGTVPATNVARWDGAWHALGAGFSGASGGGTVEVRALCVFDDGSGPALYAGGHFVSAGLAVVNHVARWDGTVWQPLGTGVTGAPAGAPPVVRALEVFDDGSGPALYVGGSFTAVGGLPASGLARWDGSGWAPVGAGVTGGMSPDGPTVAALVAGDAGAGPVLFVGGSFTGAGGTSAQNVARWDGAGFAALGTGIVESGPTGGVLALTIYDEGSGPGLHVGGDFVQAGALPAFNLARWDGVGWTANGVLGGALRAFATYDAGGGPDLYCGGRFSVAGGLFAGHIARWNCPSSVSISASQPGGGGAPVRVSNTNLTASREYLNVFSVRPCLGGLGTGPWVGLCAQPGPELQLLVMQVGFPVGTPPFRFVAAGSTVLHPPLVVPPLTIEGRCLDVTAGVIGPMSPVIQLVVL